MEIICNGQIIPFANIMTIHWNNEEVPQVFRKMNKVVTDRLTSNIEHLVPAHYIEGIISIFPLKTKIANKSAYIVIPYKFVL